MTSCATYKDSNSEPIEYLKRDVNYYIQTYEHARKQPLAEFKQSLINEATVSIEMLLNTVDRLRSRTLLQFPNRKTITKMKGRRNNDYKKYSV